MGNGLEDLAKHNTWANAEILAFCGGLDESTLDSTVPGTYGTIIETLQHLIDSEGSYMWRLTQAWSDHPWRDNEAVGIDVLAERAAVLGETLIQFVGTDWDPERWGEGRGDNGDVFAIRAGIFLTQALHHANEHRAHVCTILGALGIEPPDVSAWGYAQAFGREVLKTPGGSGA
jgi:uncharacterized damage-inducible protein DinB